MYKVTAITKSGDPVVLTVKWVDVLPALQKFRRLDIEAFASTSSGKTLYIISPVTKQITKIKVG